MNTTPTPQVQVGDTIYAKWAVGPAQAGSGWVDPRYYQGELDAWVVAEVWAYGYMVKLPRGGHISIYDGQFETEPRQAAGPVVTQTKDGHTRTIAKGDTVVNFRGQEYLFDRVTRRADEGRSAKVLVVNPDTDQMSEYYSSVFPGLEVN